MRSRTRKSARKKLIMFPLMDMFFILLVFYLMVHGGTKPIKRNVGVPQPVEIGEANTIIQIMDADRFLWLDSAAIRVYDSLGERALLESAVVNTITLARKISEMKTFLQSHSVASYLVLIRCPDRVDYAVVDDLFTRLGGYVSPEEDASGEVEASVTNSLLVSLMGGSIDELGFASGRDEKGSFLQVGFDND